MRFLLARIKHLHRRLIGMLHAIQEPFITQGIDQGLQPHAAYTDPLTAC